MKCDQFAEEEYLNDLPKCIRSGRVHIISSSDAQDELAYYSHIGNGSKLFHAPAPSHPHLFHCA